MKKLVTFYQDEKTIYCVSRNNKKFGRATCGKTDKFDIVFGMKLAFFRMIANPRKLYYCSGITHDKISSAIVEIADNAVMECYTAYGFDRGYHVGAYGYNEKLPEQVAHEEYFVSQKGIISILFEDN